jgi:SAM-dependent methyltransferase
LFLKRGRVLELGSGNGNNLLLFAAYGWHVTGVDYDRDSIDGARMSFEGFGYDGKFHLCDLSKEIPDDTGFDVILLPNMIYYFLEERAVELITAAARRAEPGAHVFCRFRTPLDFRFGRGQQISHRSFRMTENETGEKGTIQSFYEPHEMLAMLTPFRLQTDGLQVLSLMFDNPQNGRMVRNYDAVIWGRSVDR